ncbi:hypothetical protein GGR54DRAFT_317543 [Hypoxylon sp. NC1633]|nr:hypothetical protein GGR54DRAFT_317543 [Hypoxylon sp. NC1633]
MSEEPSLPPLPAPPVNWDPNTHTITRKRTHDRDQVLAPLTFSNSSDPAIFSSDDDPDVENYIDGHRHKRRYVGSWFNQIPASSDSTFSEDMHPSLKPRRTFLRQSDSGVWMGSDISDDADFDDGFVADIPVPRRPNLWEIRSRLRHARPIAPLSHTNSVIWNAIQAAVDVPAPLVDLSNCNIDKISNVAISQLSLLNTYPLITQSHPFSPIEPQKPYVELYLSNNPLRRIPAPLFNLDNLTVLSLRHTKITELPPTIANLRNLVLLNLSMTRLRYLPSELLDLFKYPGHLRTLTIHPNSFYSPDHLEPGFTDRDVWDDSFRDKVVFSEDFTGLNGQTIRLWVSEEDDHRFGQGPGKDGLCLMRARALARSPVQYSDSRGSVVSKFRLPQPGKGSGLNIQTEDMSLAPSLPKFRRKAGTPSRVPSLFDLTLRSCAKTGQLRNLASYLPERAPQHFREIFDDIADRCEGDGNDGDIPCSVCGRRVMAPLAQWIEWWELSKSSSYKPITVPTPISAVDEEKAVPFMRRACSWKCLPKPMQAGETLSGTIRVCELSALSTA